MKRARPDTSAYRAREQRALDDLATATTLDPKASPEDLECARRRLIPTRETVDFSRLSIPELRTTVALLRRALGRPDAGAIEVVAIPPGSRCAPQAEQAEQASEQATPTE